MWDRKTNPAQQEIVQSQLTLRAVLWDIPEAEEVDTGRLDLEIGLFQISRIRMRQPGDAPGTSHMEETTYASMRYQKAVESLRKLGIPEKEAIVVTDDAGMAEYAYGPRHAWENTGTGVVYGMAEYAYGPRHTRESTGTGVVYYEKEGSQKDVPADMTVLGFEEIGVQFLDRIQKRRNHLPWNILYTERTCVREITVADLDELYMLYEGEGITDYTEPLYERQKEEEYTRSYIDHMYYYYGYGMWVVRDRKTGALAGRAGFNHREVEGEVLIELGYMIGREYQNQGYATEVCRAVMEYAWQELGMEQLHCFIHPDNRISLHLAEKLGFEMVADPCTGQEQFLHFRKAL